MAFKSIKTLTFLALLSTTLLQAQFEFGVKGGLNYDSLGDVDYTDISATDLSAGSKTGYHIGAYGKIDLLLFYLRPEIQFTKINSGFADKNIGLSKIEAPILLGYKILGPLSVFAGPSFQYILNEDLEGTTFTDIEENFTVGLQIGTRISFGRLGLGVRYERGFTDNDLRILGTNGVDVEGRIDARPNQFIISASYELKARSGSDD
ncbi:MAG: outer membrane beta-barrel protein [Flavobacteriaceae bacterium]|nr:outer membrane beta-barrel protein [Flavobacteriaceae bacterium]